jgi:hypothetical protein
VGRDAHATIDHANPRGQRTEIGVQILIEGREVRPSPAIWISVDP